MSSSKTKVARWSRVVGMLAMALGGLGPGNRPATALDTGAAQQPLPIQGLVRVVTPSQTGPESPKTAIATCPRATQVVLGGGGRTIAPGAPSPGIDTRLTLRALMPERRVSTPAGLRDRYVVTAAATVSTRFDWRVEAHAFCAEQLGPGLRDIRHADGSTPVNNQNVKRTRALCNRPGERVLGSGARLEPATVADRLVLQVARSSRPGDIARAEARERPNVVDDVNWNVHARAVCAPQPDLYTVVFAESQQRASETLKRALAQCPTCTRVIGGGGAISSADNIPGTVSLHSVNTFPFGVEALAVENTPTTQSWDFIVAAAICARAVPIVD